MRIIATAPGKSILAGEHAVVYGHPALLAANSFFMELVLDAGAAGSISLSWLGNKQTYDVALLCERAARTDDGIPCAREDFLPLAIGTILNAAANDLEIPHLGKSAGFSFTINGNIPLGSGCGSSAAIAGVLAAGILHWYSYPQDNILPRTPATLAMLESWIHQSEQRMHGSPSGADGATIVHGGLLRYQRLPSGEKSYTPLPPPSTLPVLTFIHAGKPAETTGELVAAVRQLYESNREETEASCSTIAKSCLKLERALPTGDTKLIFQAVRENQQALSELGVVSADVDAFCHDVARHGGAAKISGAGGISPGGGGSILCFGLEKATVHDLCKQYDFTPYDDFSVGTAGITSRVVE